MNKVCILLSVLLLLSGSLMGAKLMNVEEPGKPRLLYVNGDRCFVVEGETVYVYSLTEKKMTAKFGKRGEGPGELRFIVTSLLVLPDSYYVTTPFEAAWFNFDGSPKKKKNFTNNRGAIPIKDGFVVMREGIEAKEERVWRRVFLTNNELEGDKEVCSMDVDANSPHFKKKPQMILHYQGIYVHDNKIFAVDSAKGFYIDVYDLAGKPLYRINHKMEPVELTDAHEKAEMDELKITNKRVYDILQQRGYAFYDNFPALRHICFSGDKIYAFTYREKEGKREIVEMDLKGKILKKVYHRIHLFKARGSSLFENILYTVSDGKLYQMVENEAEEQWELHVTEL